MGFLPNNTFFFHVSLSSGDLKNNIINKTKVQT